MCRYLYSDQVIGSAFHRLWLKQERKIDLSRLVQIEKNLDKELRQKNDTIVYMPISEVYLTIEKYGSVFKLSGEEISLRETFIKENEDEVLEILDDYFIAGLPKDISATITSYMLAYV